MQRGTEVRRNVRQDDKRGARFSSSRPGIYERWSEQGDRSEKARALVAAVMEVVGSAAAAGMAAEGCTGRRKEYDKRREETSRESERTKKDRPSTIMRGIDDAAGSGVKSDSARYGVPRGWRWRRRRRATRASGRGAKANQEAVEAKMAAASDRKSGQDFSRSRSDTGSKTSTAIAPGWR